MSREIPVWRVTHGHGPGDWTLVADGHLKASVEHALPQATGDVFHMWSASVESIIREELTSDDQRSTEGGRGAIHVDPISARTYSTTLYDGSELPQCPPHDGERRNYISSAKENWQPNPMGLGLLAEKNSGRVLKSPSPKKRGILTANSALCNGSAAAPKRQRQSGVQPLFQTASMKPVQISSSAMQKAKALLGFDDIRPYPTNGKEPCPSSNSPSKDASTMRAPSGGFERQVHDDAIVGSILKQSANVSACLFQTATGKAVSISNAGTHKAMALFGNRESSNLGVNPNQVSTSNSTVDHASLSSGLDRNSYINTFQTCRGQPISMSRPMLAKFLEEEDLPFPLESSSSSSTRLVAGQQSAKASACLFQTATGKAVSISNLGMHRAAALFGDKETSNIDINPGINMFQTARGQSVSVSSTAVKQAAKLLGEENFSFPVEAPSSSPSIRFVTGKGQSVSVSSSAMKRAKDLLGGELENSDILAPAHLINGEEHNSQRLFETSGGHLIKVSSGSIQRARVLLKDKALNNSLGACTLPTHTLDKDGFKTADAQELPSRKGFKALHNHAVQEPNLPSIKRKGVMPRKFVASFKAPRRQQPAMPPATSCPKEGPIQSVKHDFSKLVNMNPLSKREKQKSSFKDFSRQQPHQEKELGHLTKKIETVTSETAKNYKFSSTLHGLESVGSDEFRAMLLEVGANSQIATKEWVDNHYRWIVWKLASLERSYPSKVANKLLTIQTVFDELRYRYEREVDCAHRSAIKKLTEGDAAAGRMMVLCVAAVNIRDNFPQTNLVEGCLTQPSGDFLPVQIEVTDGWYSLIARLDPPLVSQLLAGKVFIGQKLRVCRATLLGCTTPMPPLEAYQVMKLALHINGTYRAHWMDKLGFCKGMPMPLAFHCIKPDGGLVPRTIIGIHRIYPVLYYERLPNRGSITRSARAEDLAVRGFHDRRNQIAEEAVGRMERECIPQLPENDVEEGAKIFRLLENSAEPELLMADMSAAQHAIFAAYQAKREAARQALAQKKILQALGEVHLDAREVTPFMKLSVMGLSFARYEQAREYQNCGRSTKGGIVTVWQVTEEQVDSLKEGAVFCVSDLYPLPGRSTNQSRNSVLHLRATKTTKWQLLPQATFSCFTPRQAMRLSLLGTLPFRSEFDVAVLIVHVGKPYACGLHRRQWLFASDGSVEEEFSKESQNLISLLAIDLSTSSEAFLPVKRSLEGCIMGYCNLIKRCRDERNCMWVAEASESSIFSSNLSSGNFSHLKVAADSVNKWAKSSERSLAELEERIQMALAGGS